LLKLNAAKSGEREDISAQHYGAGSEPHGFQVRIGTLSRMHPTILTSTRVDLLVPPLAILTEAHRQRLRNGAIFGRFGAIDLLPVFGPRVTPPERMLRVPGALIAIFGDEARTPGDLIFRTSTSFGFGGPAARCWEEAGSGTDG
jgi:hypothetical protein